MNLTILGCFNDLWFMISLCTCSSICKTNKTPQSTKNREPRGKDGNPDRKMSPIQYSQTFWPLSMNLTARSSLVHLSLTSLATPKFPDPMSFTISYLSMISSSLQGLNLKDPKKKKASETQAGNRGRGLQVTVIIKLKSLGSRRKSKI